MLQVLDCLEVVALLVLKEDLKRLEHLDQVVPLVDQIDQADGLQQLTLLFDSPLLEIRCTEVSSGIEEGQDCCNDRQGRLLLTLELIGLLLLSCAENHVEGSAVGRW